MTRSLKEIVILSPNFHDSYTNNPRKTDGYRLQHDRGHIRFCALILDFDQNIFLTEIVREIDVKHGIIG